MCSSEMDYIVEPESKIIRYGPEVVEEIRREHNLDKKEDREEAIAILDRWVKSQDHLVKKNFSKGYLERCIITSNGSVERAKQQIDKLCTFKTLLPKYFQITNILESEINEIIEKGYIAIMPTLTENYHRIMILKLHPNVDIKPYHNGSFIKLLLILAEFIKSNDYCRGYTVIYDYQDNNAANVLSLPNFEEMLQFLPILSKGYGYKLKGFIHVTASKFIYNFLKVTKTFLSDKLACRTHVATSTEDIGNYLPIDILPKEYGGKEQSLKVLHDNLIKELSSEKYQEFMKEMNKACTDETKRKKDQFNEQCLGMPGTFRTLSLD